MKDVIPSQNEIRYNPSFEVILPLYNRIRSFFGRRQMFPFILKRPCKHLLRAVIFENYTWKNAFTVCFFLLLQLLCDKIMVK